MLAQMQMGNDFFANFLRGLQVSNNLLTQFMRREQLDEELKQAREKRKETETLLKVELANALGGMGTAQAGPLQQGFTGLQEGTTTTGAPATQEQRDLLTATVQGGAANANVPMSQALLSARPQAETSRGERLKEAKREKLLTQARTDIANLIRRAGPQSGITEDQIPVAVEILTVPFPNEEARNLFFRQVYPDVNETLESKLRLRLLRYNISRAEDAEAAGQFAMGATGIPNATIAGDVLNSWLGEPDDPVAIKENWNRYRAIRAQFEPDTTGEQALANFISLHPASRSRILASIGQTQVPDVVVNMIQEGITKAKEEERTREVTLRDLMKALDDLIDKGQLRSGLALTPKDQAIIDRRFRQDMREAARLMFDQFWAEIEF